MNTDVALVVIAYNTDRLKRFLPNLFTTDLGTHHHLYFIHNSFEVPEIQSRSYRTQDQISEVSLLLRYFPHPKIIIERENVGEDLGAQWYAYNLLKDKYKYLFFINEAATINKPGLLKEVCKVFDENPEVMALSPQVCKGIDYPYCLPSTYWGIRTSFDLKWNKPLSRGDAEIQEMTLVYPQVNSQGYKIAQIGSGDWVSYKNPTLYAEGFY